MTARRTAPAPGVAQTRACIIERDASGSAERRVRFVASDETVDRYGDIIRASGWQLENFRNNPVLLFGHNSRDLPVGRVDPIAVEGTRLIAHAQFLPEGTTAFADSVWQLVDQGFLNAVSVGFMPLASPVPIFDAKQHVTGFEWIAQELLELSVVPVPANPNALQLAKSFALSADEMRCLFDDGTAARVAGAARNRIITLARLGRHQAAPPAQRGA
jgi:HK97 family phage prohead protease